MIDERIMSRFYVRIRYYSDLPFRPSNHILSRLPKECGVQLSAHQSRKRKIRRTNIVFFPGFRCDNHHILND